MPTISLTLPVSGTVITAGLHSTNYTIVQNLVNGGLDTANWASGKIFAPSKFMQEGATKFQVPGWDGTQFTPADKTGLYGSRLASAVDVNTSVAETTLFSQVVTGGDLGTNRRLVPYLSGDFLHNNVAGDTVTIRFKFGGTTYATLTSSLGGTVNATRRPWFTPSNSTFIANQLATNVQDVCVQVIGNSADGTFFGWSVGNFDMLAIDTTANQTFAVTAQWSASSANNSFRIREAFLLLV